MWPLRPPRICAWVTITAGSTPVACLSWLSVYVLQSQTRQNAWIIQGACSTKDHVSLSRVRPHARNKLLPVSTDVLLRVLRLQLVSLQKARIKLKLTRAWLKLPMARMHATRQATAHTQTVTAHTMTVPHALWMEPDKCAHATTDCGALA